MSKATDYELITSLQVELSTANRTVDLLTEENKHLSRLVEAWVCYFQRFGAKDHRDLVKLVSDSKVD